MLKDVPRWVWNGVLFTLVFSGWIPALAFWGKNYEVTVVGIIRFELILVVLCFGSAWITRDRGSVPD